MRHSRFVVKCASRPQRCTGPFGRPSRACRTPPERQTRTGPGGPVGTGQPSSCQGSDSKTCSTGEPHLFWARHCSGKRQMREVQRRTLSLFWGDQVRQQPYSCALLCGEVSWVPLGCGGSQKGFRVRRPEQCSPGSSPEGGLGTDSKSGRGVALGNHFAARHIYTCSLHPPAPALEPKGRTP